jgi:hypothetical protein
MSPFVVEVTTQIVEGAWSTISFTRSLSIEEKKCLVGIRKLVRPQVETRVDISGRGNDKLAATLTEGGFSVGVNTDSTDEQ